MKYESSTSNRFPVFTSLNCFMKYMLFAKKILSPGKRTHMGEKKKTTTTKNFVVSVVEPSMVIHSSNDISKFILSHEWKPYKSL